MEKLASVATRLIELKDMDDLEPYRDEVIQLRGIVNSYESDGVKVGHESGRSLHHNVEVSLEGIGAIKDAVINTLKKLWELLIGKSSGGGSGSSGKDKAEKIREEGKKEIDKMKEELKKKEKARKEVVDNLHKLGESGIPGSDKNGLNINLTPYKLDIKNKDPQITSNNPRNKVLDVNANHLMEFITKQFPLLFVLIGKGNVTMDNLKEGLRILGKQDQSKVWKEYMDYVNEKEVFSNKETNDLHKFIVRAEDVFGEELIPNESPISIKVVSLTGRTLGILWVIKHDKTKELNKDLTFHFKEYTVADSFVNTLKITDNTISMEDITEISNLLGKIKFLDSDEVNKITDAVTKDKKRFTTGSPATLKYEQSALRMAVTLTDVSAKINKSKASLNDATAKLSKAYKDSIAKTEKYRMSTLKTDDSLWDAAFEVLVRI